MENKEELVRKVAQRVIKKYELHPPIDVISVVKNKGINYCEEDLGSNGDGYSDLAESRLRIVVNSKIDYMPRKRFTVAHELGHVFISWHDDVTLCVTDNEYIAHNMLDIQEREANIFASELLMPTEWVRTVLREEGEKEMKKVVTTLSDRAQTSLMASFYALENAMEPGHVFFVSGMSPFVKMFISGKSNTICFRGYGYQETCECISKTKEQFKIGYYEVVHYILPKRPAEEELKIMLQEDRSIVERFVDIFKDDYSAWIVWAKEALFMIQQTCVAYLYLNDDLIQSYNCKESEIVLNYGGKMAVREQCDIFGYDYEVIDFDETYSMVFVKEPEYEMPPMRNYFCDSKELLKRMLAEIYYDKSVISKISYRVNGIIGAALSHREGMTKKQIYNLLQKKLRRLDLVEFVEDTRFNDFVFLKIIEKSS